jgi:hypothetical protein
MIGFIELLKNTIDDVKATGGASVERSAPSQSLLQQIREYVLKRITETKTARWFLFEWMTQGLFDEYIRVSVVYLRKLGITDEDLTFRTIIKVIDAEISSQHNIVGRDPSGYEELLASSLLLVWEQMGDEQTLLYTFAQQRWLISWNYSKRRWQITGLGNLFLELSHIPAAAFLLSIDSLSSSGDKDFRFIGTGVLKGILDAKTNHHKLPPGHRVILTKLGVVRDGVEAGTVEMTPVGRIIISRVLDEDNPLRRAASSLMEIEGLGETGGNPQEWSDRMREFEQ